MTAPSTADRGYRTQNPATGELVREYPTATDAEVAQALDAAQAAFEQWSSRPLSERAAIVKRASELLAERAKDIAAVVTKEMGKRLGEAIGEVRFSAQIFGYYADNAATLLAHQEITDFDGGTAYIEKLPLGPILGIMPWNYPIYQVARFAAPNLVLGNTVLLKHAEITPECAQLLQDLLDEAGLPAGVYQNLFASHDQVSTIIADPRVQGVSLTGSERAGAAVAEQAGRHLKKCVLELGGSDPYIVLSAADAREAAREALQRRMGNWGQACNSNKRMIVMEDLYEDFVDELVTQVKALRPGDPTGRETDIYGPLSSEAAADGLAKQIADARAGGATVHVGGERVEGPAGGGFYLSPAVITDVDEDNAAYRDELFGPACVVYKVSSADEAVDLANDSAFGLGSAVYSTDTEQAKQVASRLHVGMANVNMDAAMGAQMPFGGVKRSGFGRELGPLGIDEFANKRLYAVKG
ncbi:NAD-dependent succinate-semialdehyde dehydrogenase [Micrococcus lylae]|uniref:NAD-dependent succinate-semialdehyde dehydrogenase n=1 Tax=Micrococcus lylae TaxID=1273 RepID=UPI0021A886C0|nr:NAD-dependent succinate-semialdehyde dehydrogenase [Micrococcus lylae]MCT2006955.1 NAD-dependent succinate-semialdehyde dehydrogenase [Micrococcus lylae]MCT2070778.1 NAD-dependent succinate-semialdehyde dehydrogenase [Micrococcus lylae]